MSPLPTLIRAKDTADLVAQVKAQLEAGKDLHSPLFATEYGGLCQWMIRSRPFLFDYFLIDAAGLSDLELQVRNLTELGFDFVFNTVLWRGRYLQWMCRMGKRAVHLASAERSDELQLVADVQAVLQMGPRTRGEYAALTIPFVNDAVKSE